MAMSAAALLLAAAGAWVVSAQTDRAGEAAPGIEQELAAARARVARVERTVERLQDERDIETLQRTYGYFTDKAMWQEAADLFADDATLEIGGRGVFVGKPHILKYLRWLAPKRLTYGRLLNHLQLQPVITIAPDGRTAKARWRWLAEIGDYHRRSLWSIGTYENEYVRQDGVWKIESLHAYFRMTTPYAEGWAKAAVPNTHPERDLPPDRPPTVIYESYPAPFIPPYDYPNPVTGRGPLTPVTR